MYCGAQNQLAASSRDREKSCHQSVSAGKRFLAKNTISALRFIVAIRFAANSQWEKIQHPYGFFYSQSSKNFSETFWIMQFKSNVKKW